MPIRVLFSYKKGLYVDEYPVPEPGYGEVLVRVKYAGLCASDLHYMDGRFKYGIAPIVPGHEGSGIVEGVGDGVKSVSVGDKVIIDYVRGCGVCRYCLAGYENRCEEAFYHGFEAHGTFQEYIVVPERNVVKIPSNLSLVEASIVGCAVVTPYHAIREIGGVWGKSVAVVGLGGVGLHAVLLSRVLGAKYIAGLDIDERKEDAAYDFGVDLFLNSSDLEAINRVIGDLGDGFDVVFEYVGLPDTVALAMNLVGKGGIIVVGGLISQPFEINFSEIISGEKRIYGFEDHTYRDLMELVDLIQRMNISLDKSISHRFPLSKLEDAINLLRNKSEVVKRIVLEI